MRQFGNGQTITFFAPPDIDVAIRISAGKRDQGEAKVEVADVIKWAMLETCADIRHHAATWAQQGIDHRARSQSLASLPYAPSNTDVIPVRDAWLQPEARTLKEMYYLEPAHDIGNDVPKEIGDRLKEIGLGRPMKDNMDEEQEREVTHEIEEELQKEAPPPATASKPEFSPALRYLVQEGKLRKAGFSRLDDLLAAIPSWSEHSSFQVFSRQILATTDFEKTTLNIRRTDLMKPVQWILVTTTFKRNYVIVVSQFEANELIPMLSQKNGPIEMRLHMYAPRVAKSMRVFDELMFHCTPPTFQGNTGIENLMLQVNIIAGQLYPTSWEDFNRLCDFLGISNDPERHPNAMNDRFVLPADRDKTMGAACPFKVSPIQFLKDVVALRRKGEEFELTPMGRLLAGRRLFKEDFDA